MECNNAQCIEEINDNNEQESLLGITDSRITLSILFGISGIIFFILFMDSHYKNMKNAANSVTIDAAFGKKCKQTFGKILKKKSINFRK